MRQIFLTLLLSVLLASPAWAQEPDAAEAESEASEEAQDEPNGDGVKSPKTLSGMSILGNEEAPKSLVIIPWKSSRMGDEIGLSDTLDDRAQPVDKEVFLRELHYYEMRAGGDT